MRLLAAVAVLALTACSSEPEVPRDLIECALGGSGAFEKVCEVERSKGAEGLELTVRHPDGGFRRFVVTSDGSGVAVADGAEPAVVSVGEGSIEVTVGADRYRLPATTGKADGAQDNGQ